jgi:hypothetical protein
MVSCAALRLQGHWQVSSTHVIQVFLKSSESESEKAAVGAAAQVFVSCRAVDLQFDAVDRKCMYMLSLNTLALVRRFEPL